MVKTTLTAKQQRFCEEFTIDLNATQAAIRAGYSEKCCNEIGSQNLAKVSIKQEIARLQADFKAIMAGSREKSAKDYEEMRQLAIQQRQPAAGVSAIRWRDGLFGLQTTDNAEKDTVTVINVINYAGVAGVKPPKSVESEVIDE